MTMTDLSGASSAPFCDVARPIFWSDGDTSDTIEAVKEHNSVGKKLCGWGNFGTAGFGQGGFGMDAVGGNSDQEKNDLNDIQNSSP